MKSLKGTRTEKNLLTSFAGESQARNRYTFFASAAKKEKYEQIAALFLETAENEKEHAKVFFKYLEGGDGPLAAGSCRRERSGALLCHWAGRLRLGYLVGARVDVLAPDRRVPHLARLDSGVDHPPST